MGEDPREEKGEDLGGKDLGEDLRKGKALGGKDLNRERGQRILGRKREKILGGKTP